MPDLIFNPIAISFSTALDSTSISRIFGLSYLTSGVIVSLMFPDSTLFEVLVLKNTTYYFLCKFLCDVINVAITLTEFANGDNCL